MLTYNTQQKKLKLPEYGRTIQQMVDHCLTIEDRDKRNACAKVIVASMANLFPQVKNNPEERMKLWDHLAMMADFKLDIDYPCEIVNQDELNTKPQHIDYNNAPMRFKHYGKSMEWMVQRAAEWPEGDERNELVRLLANQMKKSILTVTGELVEDGRIFNDLRILSGGAINIDPTTMPLHDYKALPQPTGKKKKKK